MRNGGDKVDAKICVRTFYNFLIFFNTYFFSILLLHSCLKTEERNRWSASQLREHSFLTLVVSGSLANGQQEVGKNNGNAGDDGPSHLIDQPDREEPMSNFSFFSGVPGKSRVKCEYEELQFLGKGGFGNVIKVYLSF